jgi:hypothetical protein
VLTISNRPTGVKLDVLTVAGGGTRALSLAAGGRVLDDRVLAPDAAGGPASTQLPRATERVAVVALGDAAAAGGPAPGWCAAQSLPTIGWGAALASGAVVTAQGTRFRDNRERADGGWVPGYELAKAAQVATVFTDPITAVAIVIDDYLGSDAAGQVSMRLLDAQRALDASGDPRPPEVLVDGVRTILLYAIAPSVAERAPRPAVLVEGCGKGHLGGVIGSTSGVDDLAALLATRGVEAAVGQPLVGGPGQRQVSVELGDGPVPDLAPRRVTRRRRRTTKPATKRTPAPKGRR